AVATWLSAKAPGDITSATRQSLRLWSLAYDRASALLANRPIIWLPHIKTVMGIANYRTSSMPVLGLNPVGIHKRIVTDIQCVRAALERVKGGRDVLGSPDFECNYIET